MTDTDLDALAVRIANGFDVLNAMEQDGPEHRRWFPEWEKLCNQFQLELQRRGFFETEETKYD